MATIKVIYEKGEMPAPSTDEEKTMLQRLADMPDDEIDLSDAPEVTDWSNATRGGYPHQQPSLLDEDVTDWLVQQDKETKRHINDVIRNIMAMNDKRPTVA